MERQNQKLHKVICTAAIVVSLSFVISGCSLTPVSEQSEEASTVSHENDVKPFSLPESLTKSSSSIGGINSIYISKQTGEAYALVTEESNQSAYNKNSFLNHLMETVGLDEEDLDVERAIETDRVVIYKQETESKICCYINVKNLHRDVVITLQRPGDSIDAAREMIHSYLNSVGEDDKNYVYSNYLSMSTASNDMEDNATEEQAQNQSMPPNVKQESSGNQEEDASSVASSEYKATTADDLISVIDKTASHEEGQ